MQNLSDRQRLLLHAGIYILAVLVANATADTFIKMGEVWIAWGTLAFGFTFTQRDRVHEFGRRAVYSMIGMAAVLCVIQSIVMTWMNPEAATVPWRIVGASFFAIILSEAADTEVYQRLRRRSWFVRVLGSNAVSIPLDTVFFTLAAFAGVFPNGDLVKMILGDLIAKTVIGAVAALWRGRAGIVADAEAASESGCATSAFVP